MGYNSTFEVRIKPARPPDPQAVRYYQETPLLEQVLKAIEAQADMPMYVCSGPDEHLRISDVKWYDANDDFRVVSEHFPNTVLEVTRFGEDDGDIERQYFHNGQTEGGKATIVFPPNPFEVTNALE